MPYAGAQIIFNAWDLNQYDYNNRAYVLCRQIDGQFGYVSSGIYATTGSNTFIGNQNITGNVNIVGDLVANSYTVISSSILYQTGSTKFGDSFDDTHQFTGSVYITGSTTQIGNNTLLGNTQLSGTINISGSTTFIGIHQLSGSNSILGNTIMSGSVSISGALDVHGSTNFHNHTIIMTGSMYTSGSQVITGSLDVNGNINVASGSEFYLAGNKLFNYGQFVDTTTQSGSANTAYAKKLNTTEFAHNVLIENGTRIKVLNTGIYNLQFSSQLSNTSNTNITFDIWLAYTGSNVVNSSGQVDVNKSAGQLGRSIAAWNYMLPIKANDYVELMWSCNGSTGELAAIGPQINPNRPAVPSVIVTLTQIG